VASLSSGDRRRELVADQTRRISRLLYLLASILRD
jgi:hypothetical protein